MTLCISPTLIFLGNYDTINEKFCRNILKPGLFPQIRITFRGAS